jgi:predicted RNA-binding Zn ribbon-like protein
MSAFFCDAAQPANDTSRAGSLALVGGDVAFDFVNTASDWGGPAYQEHLREPADLFVWAAHAKLMSSQEAAVAIDVSAASDVVAPARALREALRAVIGALAERETPPAGAIDLVRRVHAQALASASLTASDAGGYVWTWDVRRDPMAAVLGPIALSALTMLTSADLGRVKRCEGPNCGWVFFDLTKNRKRRWCEMEVCGNRAKQRRLGERRRARSAP